ncbi:hypothetical protein ACNFBT_00870 [Pseudomonas sp. NY15181]|uniref:hypothetical protein n=1 Tax=Pseudomonas sp. NY15181 TaxID=3400349 RepID=UPI003A870EE9
MRQNLLLLLTLPLSGVMADDYDSRFSSAYGAQDAATDSLISHDIRAGGAQVPTFSSAEAPALPVDSRPKNSMSFHVAPDGSLMRDDNAVPRTGNLSIDADETQQRANCERIRQRMSDRQKALSPALTCD